VARVRTRSHLDQPALRAERHLPRPRRNAGRTKLRTTQRLLSVVPTTPSGQTRPCGRRRCS
jgi:hypothetical protein